MKRRSFLKSSSAVSLPFFVGGMPLKAVGRNMLSSLINEDNDRVLVMINLNGGNDGLSTLIPLDQYDNLKLVRPDLLVPENTPLSLEKNCGLHPAMVGMKEIWDQGQLNIVQSVGYPNQNRSHFRSTDIWQTASDADQYLTTGWMGRYFDLRHPGFPEGYPNMEYPDPFALTIGSVISETCQGEASTYSLALLDPANPGNIIVGKEDPLPDNCYGMELAFVRDMANFTNQYSGAIQSANEKGTNLSSKYGNQPANALAQKLKIVARLISGGLRTKVYVVSLGGFDLHSGQAEEGNPAMGRQAELLALLSDALCAFQEDLSLMGLQKRVVGMTYSEFGRQIRQNASNGSDHGTAAPLFVFGACVNPSIIGDNPTIGTQIVEQEGVPMQFDFRSVYGSLLVDWFGVPEDDVRTVLQEDFQRLSLIQGCDFTQTSDLEKQDFTLSLTPNPFLDYLNITLTSSVSGEVKISIFDARGALIRSLEQQRVTRGVNEWVVEAHRLPPGAYFVRCAIGSYQKTAKLVKG